MVSWQTTAFTISHALIPLYQLLSLTQKGIWERRALQWDMLSLSGGAMIKNLSANAGDAGDAGSIPGSRRSPGEGNDNPLQYSCLENPRDRGTRWAIVHGFTKGQTPLSDETTTNETHVWLWIREGKRKRLKKKAQYSQFVICPR